MKPIRKPRWQISENKATPESVFWNRRHLLAAGGVRGGAGRWDSCRRRRRR
jgi:hypothetical protein